MDNTLLTLSVAVLAMVVLLNLLITLKWVARERSEANYLTTHVALPTGQPAPAFNAELLSGGQMALANYLGRGVLLLFVSADCDDCRRHMTALVSLFPKVQRARVSMFLVSVDSRIKARAFVDAFKIPIPALIPEKASLRAFNPRRSTPFYCYIDEKGVVQANGSVGNLEWQYLQRNWESTQRQEALRRYT